MLNKRKETVYYINIYGNINGDPNDILFWKTQKRYKQVGFEAFLDRELYPEKGIWPSNSDD